LDIISNKAEIFLILQAGSEVKPPCYPPVRDTFSGLSDPCVKWSDTSVSTDVNSTWNDQSDQSDALMPWHLSKGLASINVAFTPLH
jgi:hypothetical protein